MRQRTFGFFGLASAGAVLSLLALGFAACTDGKPDPLPSSNFSDAAADSPLTSPSFDGSLAVGDAGSLLDAACATGVAKALRDPLYMLVVLDASGSMASDGKWTAIVPALGAFIDDLASQNDSSFALGLTIFSDDGDPTHGLGPYTTVNVPLAPVDATQAAKLKARIAAAKPHYDTPTYAVLSGQYPLLEAFAPAPPLPPNGKKVLVFMTDGVPFPDDAGTERARSVDLVSGELAKASPAGPITTLAVGIGYYFPYAPTTYDPAFMGQLAVAGGAPNQPCDPQNTWQPDAFCHFQVTPLGDTAQLEQEFMLTLDKIRSRVASCDFAIEKKDGGLPVEPDKANVVFTDDNGYQSVVPEDPVDGWTYDDPSSPSRVVLHGKSCDALKANVDGKVVVVLGCDTQQK